MKQLLRILGAVSPPYAIFFVFIVFLPTKVLGFEFVLVNSSNNKDIRQLIDNDAIDLSRVGSSLNIRADIQAAENIAMVRFILDGAVFREEKSAPYALAGDEPAGNYLSWTPAVGSHSLTAVVLNAADNPLARRTISFSVSGNETVPDQTDFSGNLLSLHFDHCADHDDGHSTVADRVLVGQEGIALARVHVVSGTCGTQIKDHPFQNDSKTVMNAAWGADGWLFAGIHSSVNPKIWQTAVKQTAQLWQSTINAGNHVWIAEGGQSDFSADVVRILRATYNRNLTKARIHLVQHADWNERYTTTDSKDADNDGEPDGALEFVKNNTDYIKIGDGNEPGNGTADLRIDPDDSAEAIKAFTNAAGAHSNYGAMWSAAFNYLDPESEKLDFSDTVELLHILNIGTDRVNSCTDFADQFLQSDDGDTPPDDSNPEDDTPTDTDGDGMPDAWETRYGLDPQADDAAQDLDGDGVSNLTEYRMGTDPTAAGSKGTSIYYEYDELGRIRKISRVTYQ